MTFYEWAIQERITRANRNTPRGDFLRYMHEDWSTHAVKNTKEAWETHLMEWGVDEGQRIAFRSLWVSYCNQCGDPQRVEDAVTKQANLFFEMAATR